MAAELLGPRLARWLEIVESHLTYPVGRAVIMPGNSVVWDNCCDGQLHIRVISVVGSGALSRPAGQRCVPLFQVRIGIGVTRCAHTVDDSGDIPTPAQMTADAFQTFQDRADIVAALTCQISDEFENDNTLGGLQIGDWLPTAVQGGCVGGEVTVVYNQNMCTPCADDHEETP